LIETIALISDFTNTVAFPLIHSMYAYHGHLSRLILKNDYRL